MIAPSLTNQLYEALLGQLAAETYLHSASLVDEDVLRVRFSNGNNHFDPPDWKAPAPTDAPGATRFAETQIVEFFKTYDIIDHLPNQTSGFSATILKNKTTGEYTLAFRSTEYQNIRDGGDAERDAVRGAAGDVAFNGMAFPQVSSMEKYWLSLLDGSRAQGATPDNRLARDTSFLRTAELEAFATAVNGGAKINVSGYSLGGHLATTFAALHGDRISDLYLFNSAGIGEIRDGYTANAYREALLMYDLFTRPENIDSAVIRVIDWMGRATLGSEVGHGVRTRIAVGLPYVALPYFPLDRPFIPRKFQLHVNLAVLPMAAIIGGLIALARDQERSGIPLGDDKRPVIASSALHFLVSLFASEPLNGTYRQTLGRVAGVSFPSLQESGIIPADVRIYQVSGRAAEGSSSSATFADMTLASDWNIVANSGIRAAPDAQLLDVYIENQPTAAGLPFADRGWGDFGNTHSITLIGDSLALTRMLLKAQPSLAQAAAETIYQAASNLRKEHYSVLPVAALAEHDTLERVVDAFGRVLFGRRNVGGIDWSRSLASANGTASFGLLEYRDPFHARIQAIETVLAERGLAGALEIVSLVGWTAADMVAVAAEATARGLALRYALKELNPFYLLGAGLYEAFGRDQLLALHDPDTGTGAITAQWLQDRADFLALKLRLGMADHAYEQGVQSLIYRSANGDLALSFADTSGLREPDVPATKTMRAGYERLAERQAAAGSTRIIAFGSDGDPAANPALVEGGADTLAGQAGADRLYGESGNDVLLGGAGSDYLEGGSGDDDLSGNAGNDVLAGGSGYDTYFWSLGDGFDAIVETREASGEIRGRIVLRLDTAFLVPRVFERDNAAPIEAWRSPDRTLLLTHGETWLLSFPDGQLDLGVDLRSGDFGFQIEGIEPPPLPTIINGVVHDTVIVGPNLAGAILFGEYGHDRLYAETPIELEAALQRKNEPGLAGWGYWLTGGPGNDVVIASAAADILPGGGGEDVLVGGPGDDLIDGDADEIPILNGHHLSWDYGPEPGESYFTQFRAPGFATGGTAILSELYRDQIAEADDVLHGGSGNDRMYGGGGDDLLYGDPGDDLLLGGAGSDVLLGGDGADRLTGELHGYAAIGFEIIGGTLVTYPHYVPAYGDDILDGGAGADELSGEGGADVLYGGEGADTIHGDIAGLPGHLHGNDVADGGPGDDALYGQGGSDVLLGGAGNDRLFGDSDVEGRYHGADTLQGDAGDDVLVGAGGADRISGGAGADTLIGDAPDVPVEFQLADVMDGGEGNDLLYGYGGSDELFGSDGDDRLYGDDPDAPFLGAADWLDGGNGDDLLAGHAGDDLLEGGSGNDTLLGDAGNDTLVGGPGADVLDGGSGDNVFEFAPGDGVDRLIAGSGIVTVAFVEGFDVSALRASRILGTSSGIAPLEIRYSASDVITLEGLADERRLRIRIGDADLLGGSELLQFSQSPGSAVTGTEGSELLFADESRSSVFALLGDDWVVGTPNADKLHGGAGDDQLYGIEGNDVLLGGDGSDRLFGGLGNDRLEGGPGDDRYEFLPDEGIDVAIELAGEGFDAIALAPGYSVASIRLRRSGSDLVLAERGGAGRLLVRNWFAPGAGGDRGVEVIVHDAGTLDTDAIVAREIADRVLLGTSGPDTLTGDEFDDTVIGGQGDDILAGLEGNDRYLYASGDGRDRIVDTGGFDVLEFGAGIDSAGIDLTGRPDGAGGLEISLALPGSGGQIVFNERRSQRIDAFHFANGEVLDYPGLLRRVGGLRIEGSAGDDVLPGTFYSDALYAFAGDDTLSSDAGDDLLVGAEGSDFLAGGANDDTYVFHPGDGRDTILEYEGTDEYLLFRGYFTAAGERAFDLDGATFRTSQPLPGFFGETFNLTLGSVGGGVDSIVFGAGIAPEDIRFGLDLGKPLLPYSWIVPDPSGGTTIGTAWAEQVAYVLELGTSGDSIEIVWPDVELEEHAAQTLLDAAPVERLVFDGIEGWSTLADVFALAGGLSYVLGSSHDDVLSGDRVLPGGWLGGGAGNDIYVRPEQGNVGILEAAGGGTDTILFGDAVALDTLRLVLEGERLFLDASVGRIELRGFSPASAEHALIERFELADGSALGYDALVTNGIEVAGTPFADQLFGTSVYDRVVAGAGSDVIDSGGGNDIVDAGAGDDTIVAGAGDDWVAAGAGNDVARGGPGQDRYLVIRGDGDDAIEESGAAGEIDTLHFGGDIAPGDIVARRLGTDLVLEVAPGIDRVTVREWFASSTMRVEHFVFNDGTEWDVAAVATLAGEPLPADPSPADPEPPAAPPSQTTDSEAPVLEPLPADPPLADPEPPAAPPSGTTDSEAPALVPPPPPATALPETPEPVLSAPTAPGPSVGGNEPQAGEVVVAGEAPAASIGSSPPPPGPASQAEPVSASSVSVVTPDEFSAENVLADLPNAAPLPAPALSGTSASVETPPGSSVSGSAGEASGAPLTLNAAPSTFESLAAEGFVSPGRALGQAGDSSHDALPSETVAPDALPSEDAASEAVAQDESSAAIAAYWKWMHERLTAHLEETEIDDLGAPPLYEHRSLGLFHTEGTEALAPSRAVGIRDRAAFEARTFEGLRDGFAMLG